MNQTATVDFFGRTDVSLEEIEAEQAVVRARRMAEKMAASRQSGTPPELITIVTMWQVY